MEENLTNFVNLLNRQRQRSPVPQELSGLPNWAQRELAKRPEALPPKLAQPTNGTKHDAEQASEIVVEATRAEAVPPPQPAFIAVTPPIEKPPADIAPWAADAKGEILPPITKAATPARVEPRIDPKQDPEAWLARFLAEEGPSRAPAPAKAPPPSATAPGAIGAKADATVQTPKPAAQKSEPPVNEFAAEKTDETPLAAETEIETASVFAKIGAPADDDTAAPMPVVADAADIVSLQPVIAEALSSPRGGRRPAAYALAAAAVIAAVALVVGAYWYTQTEAELTASTQSASPTVAPVKPQTLAKDAAKPAAPAQKPAQKTVAAKPAAPAPTTAAKPAEQPKMETEVATAPAPKPKPTPTVVKPAAPAVALAQKAPEKPQAQPAAKPAPSPSTVTLPVPAIAAAPKSALAGSTQIAMLPSLASPPTPSTAATPSAAPSAAAPSPPTLVPAQSPLVTAATSTGEPTWQRNAIPAPPFSGQPQIAIVIDDLGLDRARTERAVALAGPVTLSFLAYASDLPKQTEAARKAGHELIVHVPMEPIIQPKYISQTTGANPGHAELLRRLRWDLSRFTGYVGVNNHMGNSLSSDSDSTRAVVAELKNRGLLFLDSHVAGTGVLKAAALEGVPAVTRDILLDDDVTASSVAERLGDLEKIARQRGTAIAIGHPHDLTLDALKVWIASLPSKGLQLVPLTAVVRDREQHVAAGGAG